MNYEDMLKNRNSCKGCSLCQSICPQNAITMRYNSEGFLFPVIDDDKCIKCELCKKLCKFKYHRERYKNVFIAQAKNDNYLKNSTSGAVIPCISEYIINNGGVVFGASYDVQNGATWIEVNRIDLIQSISGSKYFQIPLSKSIYEKIKKAVKELPIVLFVGTPCQVDSVKKYVGEKDNLFTIDLICGGVASQSLEKRYIGYHEIKNETKLKKHFFRSKEKGWSDDYLTQRVFTNGVSEFQNGGEDLYIRIYNSGQAMRESCYECEYNSLYRCSDFTVGDCWGIHEKELQINIKKGVSIILQNSDKAGVLLRKLSNLHLVEATDDVVQNNRPLHAHLTRRKMRNFAYILINHLPLKMSATIIGYRYMIRCYLFRRKSK